MNYISKTNSREASTKEPCPLCNHTKYCFLISDSTNNLFQIVCQWTDEPPEGWHRTGTAKDGRGVFTKEGTRHKRKHFPDFIQLQPTPKNDIPQWAEVERPLSEVAPGKQVRLKPELKTEAIYEVKKTFGAKRRGRQKIICTLEKPGGFGAMEVELDDIDAIVTVDGNERELEIEYLYPDIGLNPLGKVRRRQWTDRRKLYAQGTKSKEINPFHWIGSPFDGHWTLGKGDREWPLYRESEAKEAILKGDVLFAVGGEQAVETYRTWGLTATTPQGGESNSRQIIERLEETFNQARNAGVTPLLVIHPDHDLTGETKYGEELLRQCRWANIPAIVIDPLKLWGEMPPGGDVKDWADSGVSQETAITTLETAIDDAIDQEELEIQARKQRARWNAPESYQGELGYWRENKELGTRYFQPKTDFDFQIERELASDDGGGLLLQVKRTDDRGQRRTFIKNLDYSSAQKFKDSMKRALGCGIVCNLTNPEVEALVRVRLHEYRITRRGKTFRLCDRVGQQSDGQWVFENLQLDKNGEPTNDEKSLWVWNPNVGSEEESTLPSPKIAEQNPAVLGDLVEVMTQAFGDTNIYPALLTLGYAAAGCHYQQIIKTEGAFPILNLFGDPGSGKTTAAECALSLVGMIDEGMMREITLSAAYEKLKLAGSLVHCLDDPTRTPELDEFLKGFYNGKARIVRGKEIGFNVQRPHSPLMVTSNHACGETSAATQSRLIRLWFAKRQDGKPEAFYELPTLQRKASGALSSLIKIGYSAKDVHEIERQLMPHLPYAHVRIAKSLALLCWYTEELLAIAGDYPDGRFWCRFDIRAYVVQNLCMAANDPDESGDSLRDFFEKVFALQAESKLGDWNLRLVEPENKPPILALHMPSVWSQLDKNYSLAYNRKVIERLIEGVGGSPSTQKFHCNEDESKAYRRGIASDIRLQNRRCLVIPIEALKNYSDMGMLTVLTDYSEAGETLENQNVIPFTSPCERDVNDVNGKNGDEKVDIPGIDGDKNVNQYPGSHIFSTGSHDVCERGQTRTGQGLDTPETPPVHIVHMKTHPQISETPKPSKGDRVLVVPGKATWFKSGSQALPKGCFLKKFYGEKEIPLGAIEGDIFHELCDGGLVVGFSRDGQRVKVRNQQTGRTSVFNLDGVQAMLGGGDVENS